MEDELGMLSFVSYKLKEFFEKNEDANFLLDDFLKNKNKSVNSYCVALEDDTLEGILEKATDSVYAYKKLKKEYKRMNDRYLEFYILLEEIKHRENAHHITDVIVCYKYYGKRDNVQLVTLVDYKVFKRVNEYGKKYHSVYPHRVVLLYYGIRAKSVKQREYNNYKSVRSL